MAICIKAVPGIICKEMQWNARIKERKKERKRDRERERERERERGWPSERFLWRRLKARNVKLAAPVSSSSSSITTSLPSAFLFFSLLFFFLSFFFSLFDSLVMLSCCCCCCCCCCCWCCYNVAVVVSERRALARRLTGWSGWIDGWSGRAPCLPVSAGNCPVSRRWNRGKRGWLARHSVMAMKPLLDASTKCLPKHLLKLYFSLSNGLQSS